MNPEPGHSPPKTPQRGSCVLWTGGRVRIRPTCSLLKPQPRGTKISPAGEEDQAEILRLLPHQGFIRSRGEEQPCPNGEALSLLFGKSCYGFGEQGQDGELRFFPAALHTRPELISSQVTDTSDGPLLSLLLGDLLSPQRMRADCKGQKDTAGQLRRQSSGSLLEGASIPGDRETHRA